MAVVSHLGLRKGEYKYNSKERLWFNDIQLEELEREESGESVSSRLLYFVFTPPGILLLCLFT